MSDEKRENLPGEPAENKKNFIRETVEPPKNKRKRRFFVRLFSLLVSAVIFGVIACVTFVLVRPFAEQHLGGGAESTEDIVIPRDSTDEAQETESETETAALDEQAIEDIVQAKIDACLETDEEKAAAKAKQELTVSETAAKALTVSLVTVTSRSTGEDVFLNSYTRSEQSFGLILAKTGKELRILTECQLTSEDGVYVTLKGEQLDAKLLADDATFGMSVVSVKKEDMSEELWDYAQAAALANSYTVHQGDAVAALGNPLDYTGSVLEGTVAYVNTLQQGSDMNFQLIQTDIAADQKATGILVDEEGQVIGWVTQQYNSESMAGLLAAVSISDLKGILENLTNGFKAGYMGIQFRAVTSAIAKKQEIPTGLYITKCLKDSPALEAGLQPGDILTKIGEDEVLTEREFESKMEELEAGSDITVTVMRKSRGAYVEMTYDITLGSR